MNYKLAVFDIAGTVLADDDAVVSAFSKAFADSGYTVKEEDVRLLMGYKKQVAVQIMFEQIGVDATAELVEQVHSLFVSEMIDHYLYSPGVKAMPGAENVLTLFKEKGIRVALNTGFSKDIADTILHRLQWREKGLVDDYIASDEVEKGRPLPFMINKLMERAGVADPGEVVKIGDTEVDVNEGFLAHCGLVVAVTTGAFTREQLIPYGPHHIIDHLDELPAIIF